MRSVEDSYVPFTAEELAAEEWRAIAGYPRYEVSNLGRVRSYPHSGWTTENAGKPRFLRPATKGPTDHLHLTLHRDNVPATAAVHKLVLEAFVGPKPDGMECCHCCEIGSQNSKAVANG